MSRNLRHLVPSRVADTLKEFKGVIRNGSSSYRLEFVSTITDKLFWRTATGVTVIEPEASVGPDQYFYILVEYEFDIGQRFDTRELMANISLPSTDPTYKTILERLQGLEDQTGILNHRKFRYVLGVSRKQLEDAGGAVYLQDLDIVVGFDRCRDDVLHPYSANGLAQLLSTNFIHDAEGLSQRYLFVDNSGTEGSRWINLWYGVFELKPFRNPQLADGVHITLATMGKQAPYTARLSLAEAESALGLYKSKSEAECFGRPDVKAKEDAAAREREWAELKHQLTLEKHACEREREELDREKAARNERLKEEDARRKRERDEFEEYTRRERDKMDLERERLKSDINDREMRSKMDYEAQRRSYEFQKMDRNDRSEYVKAALDIGKGILSLLTIGLSIYAVMQKSKGSSK